jgi:hypothetical protein
LGEEWSGLKSGSVRKLWTSENRRTEVGKGEGMLALETFCEGGKFGWLKGKDKSDVF